LKAEGLPMPAIADRFNAEGIMSRLARYGKLGSFIARRDD
jgi:hypothetical protein